MRTTKRLTLCLCDRIVEKGIQELVLLREGDEMRRAMRNATKLMLALLMAACLALVGCERFGDGENDSSTSTQSSPADTSTENENSTREQRYFVQILDDWGGHSSFTKRWFPAGTRVTVRAIPDSGYHFVSWSEVVSGSWRVVSTDKELELLVDRNIMLKTDFAED